MYRCASASGTGIARAIYEDCLCYELDARHLSFVRQVSVPVVYKGTPIDAEYRLDVVVEDQLIVELKAVEWVLPVHLAQLRTYLRVTGFSVGLLVNFNVPLLRHGLHRIEPTTVVGSSSDLPPPSSP